ncbi:hypothetical protein BB559_002829 [Furculomyces boomerangus]|uniref:Uncharacterized protein n=1 Tax=Furculomyces boomerangus TaxID=61424 RepID=A0A2T9YSB4_9FUNG|nr:hypothetical protein BB559_002829 [Furculomyces boomerangus]
MDDNVFYEDSGEIEENLNENFDNANENSNKSSDKDAEVFTRSIKSATKKASSEREAEILDIVFQITLTKDNQENISPIRCAAHTLQLAVFDVLKKNLFKKIKNCRSICVKLRTPNIMNIIKVLNQNKPKLDVSTRWNST